MVDGPNLYVYCNNDPINFVDLWGLQGEKKTLIPPMVITIQRALSGLLSALDKPYKTYISEKWYYETMPFRSSRNFIQGAGLVFGGLRVIQPWMQMQKYSSIESATTVVSVRALRFGVVTVATSIGAETGAKLGMKTGKFAPIATPILAATGAVVFGDFANWAMSKFENAALDWAGIQNQ